jgi:hypothetical protein
VRRKTLNFFVETDDLQSVTIDEGLIREVFLRVSPGDLDHVLTAIEAYRMCVSTCRKLPRTRYRRQKREVMECARSCERALAEYVATGCWRDFQYPPAARAAEFQRAHLVLMLAWQDDPKNG